MLLIPRPPFRNVVHRLVAWLAAEAASPATEANTRASSRQREMNRAGASGPSRPSRDIPARGSSNSDFLRPDHHCEAAALPARPERTGLSIAGDNRDARVPSLPNRNSQLIAALPLTAISFTSIQFNQLQRRLLFNFVFRPPVLRPPELRLPELRPAFLPRFGG